MGCVQHFSPVKAQNGTEKQVEESQQRAIQTGQTWPSTSTKEMLIRLTQTNAITDALKERLQSPINHTLFSILAQQAFTDNCCLSIADDDGMQRLLRRGSDLKELVPCWGRAMSSDDYGYDSVSATQKNVRKGRRRLCPRQ